MSPVNVLRQQLFQAVSDVTWSVFLYFLTSSFYVSGYNGFPDSSVGEESACNAGDPGSIPGSGRSAGEGIGYPLQYSWASLVAQLLKNPPAMRETWSDPWVRNGWRRERPAPGFWLEKPTDCTVHRVVKSQTGKPWGSLCPARAWLFIWPNSPKIFILLHSCIIAQTPSWWHG